MNKYVPGTFILVPSKSVLKEVDAISQSLFLWLCEHTNNKTGKCFPSINRLAQLCRVSKNTIKNRMKQLEKAGLIKKETRKKSNGMNATNLYTILIHNQRTYKTKRSGYATYEANNDTLIGHEMDTNIKEYKQEEMKESKNAHVDPEKFFKSDPESLVLIANELYQNTHLSDKTIKIEIGKFILYWTEPTHDGTRERWQLEKTFEIRRRIFSWFSKIQPTNRRGSGAGVTV